MRIAQIRKYDISNGPGIRATLFVSGCTHNCEDCFNKEYQNFSFGTEMMIGEVDEFLSYAEDEKVVGINILGGEPLQQTMDKKLTTLLHILKLKEQTKDKPIWLWTGYKLEDIANNNDIMLILKYVDVLIDGKFEKDKKDLNLRYRGSSNQRVIDMNHFRNTGEIRKLDI